MLFAMSFSAESPPAGWYPDPAGSGGERYWDGGNWSQVTRPAGGMSGSYSTQQGQAAPQSAYGQSGYGPAGYAAAATRPPGLAGFWWRVLASILDSLILWIPLSIVQNLVMGADVMSAFQVWLTDWLDRQIRGETELPPIPEQVLQSFGLAILVVMILWIAYRTVMVALRGATLGQSITGLRVVPDGSPLGTIPSWKTSGIRAVTAVIFQQLPLLGLADPLTMLFTAKKQTLHDMIARTVVIKK